VAVDPAATLLHLQRAAGNAATASLLGALPVQRRLQLSGTDGDIATTLRLLTTPSGLPLRRDRASQLVSVDGTPRPATSPALANQLRTIIDDRERTARVHVGPAKAPGQEIGAFPAKADEPVQHVFIDQVVTLEQAVPGDGSAKLAHEITENFIAQPLIAAGGVGDFSFKPSHAAAVKVEDKVLAELQAAAGGPRSGHRMRDYMIDVPDPRRGPGARRFVRAETHEHEFVLYEAVPGARVGALRITRDAGTTLGSWELVGFGRDIGLPTGSGRVLQEAAAMLTADPAAAVILEATSLAWSTMDAPQWLQDVTEGIQARMKTADSVLRFDGRFSPHPTTTSGNVNAVRITVRRPSSIPTA
jgi:hypothetical protein